VIVCAEAVVMQKTALVSQQIPACTESLIRVNDVMESAKLAE
jgi:hypothetical protein